MTNPRLFRLVSFRIEPASLDDRVWATNYSRHKVPQRMVLQWWPDDPQDPVREITETVRFTDPAWAKRALQLFESAEAVERRCWGSD